jgi:hypothetical protein
MADETKPQETPEAPAEGKKRRGRPPGAGKKPKDVKKDKIEFYVIGTGDPTECEPKIVAADNLIGSIKEFSESVEVKHDEVFVFEIGRQVKVRQEIIVTPA